MLNAREQVRVRTLRNRRTRTTPEILELHALLEKAGQPVQAPPEFKPRTVLDFQPRPDEVATLASWLDI
jgi:hypothetical protein